MYMYITVSLFIYLQFVLISRQMELICICFKICKFSYLNSCLFFEQTSDLSDGDILKIMLLKQFQSGIDN